MTSLSVTQRLFPVGKLLAVYFRIHVTSHRPLPHGVIKRLIFKIFYLHVSTCVCRYAYVTMHRSCLVTYGRNSVGIMAKDPWHNRALSNDAPGNHSRPTVTQRCFVTTPALAGSHETLNSGLKYIGGYWVNDSKLLHWLVKIMIACSNVGAWISNYIEFKLWD